MVSSQVRPVAAGSCLVAVVEARPLSVHFSLLNPSEAEEPIRVPATLGPAGAFVTLSIADGDGRPVYATERPKLKLKLDPARPESYVTLQPGYSFGTLFVLDPDELWLDPGEYTLSAAYENHEFSGPSDNPIGELSCSSTTQVSV